MSGLPDVGVPPPAFGVDPAVVNEGGSEKQGIGAQDLDVDEPGVVLFDDVGDLGLGHVGVPPPAGRGGFFAVGVGDGGVRAVDHGRNNEKKDDPARHDGPPLQMPPGPLHPCLVRFVRSVIGPDLLCAGLLSLSGSARFDITISYLQKFV